MVLKLKIQLTGEKGVRNYMDRIGKQMLPLTMRAGSTYLQAVRSTAKILSKGPWSRGGTEAIENSINIIPFGDNKLKLEVTSPHARLQEDGIGSGYIYQKSDKQMPLRGAGNEPLGFARAVRRFKPKKYLQRSIEKHDKLLNQLLNKTFDNI